MKFFFRSSFSRPLASFTLTTLGFAIAAPAQEASQPSAIDLSKKETPASALLRTLASQEYEVRSAAEAMPEELYSYHPAEGKFKDQKPEFGPAEMRTFAEQVKHVACSNFAFAYEMDHQKPPEACDQGGPDPAKTKRQLLIYLRNSFLAVRKSIAAITAKNQFDPIEGPYAGPTLNAPQGRRTPWHGFDWARKPSRTTLQDDGFDATTPKCFRIAHASGENAVYRIEV